MLILFQPVGDYTLPMTVVNVHTGKDLLQISYTTGGRMRDIEFVEQFNENILVKLKGKPLKIHNVIGNKAQSIDSFTVSPDAFIFIYERDIFVSLKSGRIAIWSIEGALINK
jgi:hypothetical protein